MNDPLVVVGDLHGQYYDALEMLRLGGSSNDSQFLFLGDYVDRGSFGCEVVFLLFALKLAHPRRVWLLRGNHETRMMTQHFNFSSEAECKYDISLWEEVTMALSDPVAPEPLSVSNPLKFNEIQMF